jgi:uncharacterized protein
MLLRLFAGITLLVSALPLFAGAAEPAPLVHPQPDARRLEILFLGAPTANGPYHDPITRYRSFKRVTGVHGINLTYSESLEEALDPKFLAQFDGLLLYANWDRISPEQERALLSYVEQGGGFVPVHCASACFGHSDPFIRLVGGRFRRHGAEIFAPITVAPDHPAIEGVSPVEAWDETYVHDRHGDDRTILQVRRDAEGDEPWTWVRQQGKGRVFYTASGHDHRVWDHPDFQALLIQGIRWAVGTEALARLERLALPVLEEKEALLPDYRQRRAITRAQAPLSPEESAKLIQVPPGFEVSLFAAEPDIVNPIYVGWDERGRAFVIETIDYPNNLQEGNIGHDRITIAEDTNGDGRADKFTVFADGLSIPTSLTFVNGGVICTNGTQLLFLKDTTGDDRADVRVVLVDGFSMSDTHAGPSNLRYGFDHWIYATIGYSGFEGTVGGEKHAFATGLFRFTPDAQRLEFLQHTTNNTWGLGFTEEFFILGSTANANPSWAFTLPAERFRALGVTQSRTPRADDNPYFFPSSTDIRQVDAHDRYTSAAGHAFYTARLFPESYHNRIAFITDPTGKLVGQFDVTPQGAAFRARQLPNNLFNSADAWTSPVLAEVGPDGAVWICDWYNLIVQHNPTPTAASAGIDAVTGPGNAYVTALRDRGHGRIWRVYPRGADVKTAAPFDPKRPATLVKALEHDNLFWRLHAQRLLIETNDRRPTDELRAQVDAGGRAAVHAFQVLVQQGAVTEEQLTRHWSSGNIGLRRAVREVVARQHPALLRRLVLADRAPILTAATPRELAELLSAVSRLPQDAEIGRRIFATVQANPHGLMEDQAMLEGWQLAARAHAEPVLQQALAADLPMQDIDRTAAGQVLQLIAYVQSGSEPQRRALMTLVERHDNAFARFVRTSLQAPTPRERAPQYPRDEDVLRRGANLYAGRCVACHGLDGQGVEGVFPPLAESEWVVRDPSVPIKIVLHGLQGEITVRGVKYDSIMPPMPDLSPQDVADVVTYIRQSFGNDASAVTVDDVQTARRGNWGRGLWTAEELQKAQGAP